MPAAARAAGRALDASVALIDRSSNVLAVAAASPDEERKLLAGGGGVETVELRVADAAVGVHPGVVVERGRGGHRVQPHLLLRLAEAQACEIAGDEEAYETAKRHAMRLLDRGFHMGGRAVPRERLHER